MTASEQKIARRAVAIVYVMGYLRILTVALGLALLVREAVR